MQELNHYHLLHALKNHFQQLIIQDQAQADLGIKVHHLLVHLVHSVLHLALQVHLLVHLVHLAPHLVLLAQVEVHLVHHHVLAAVVEVI